jgi:manganese/iron transport system ATP-binding protein
MLKAADQPTPGLQVRDVTVTYRNGHTGLWDASIDLPRGTITALVGQNGSGKSTLFKAHHGLRAAGQGQCGHSRTAGSHALKANDVAYVPQAEEVDWNFPVLVEDVVMMGRYGHMNWLRMPAAGP